MARNDKLTDLLRPAAEALGYDFWGLEYISQGKHSILRIYIDHANGITVEDCASVSHQASGILDVDDPISSQYSLEVSSPGLDRPLFTMSQFEQQLGLVVNVRSQIAVDNRRKFKGKLVSAIDNKLTMQVDDKLFEIDFDNVEKANLVVDI